MELTRREFMVAAAATLLSQPTRASSAAVSIVLAPSNLGLSPVGNKQQGAWRAPQALMDAGLARALGTDEVISLERPRYQFDAQPGTRIRNGVSIRAFSLQMAEKAADIIRRGRFPVVVGGDCSVLLGGLYGSRIAGGRGLVHIDGHDDFYHPGNYDTSRRLARLQARSLDKVWIHVDFDVLDEDVMPAVDSPGSPGFDYAQLSELIRTLCMSGRVVVADFAIYDPERDPRSRYAAPLVRCIAEALLL
jgi:arginase family enzyme